MLYELDNLIYIKENNKYYIAIVEPKENTISITPSSIYKDTLEGAKEVSFYDVKKKVLKWIK